MASAGVHIVSGPQLPQDVIRVVPVVNAGHDGSFRVDLYGKIFHFRASQPSTHATLNYTGTVVVNGVQMQKMEALARKVEAVLLRVYPNPASIQNVRAIRFQLHRNSPAEGFGLTHLSARANDSDQFVDHSMRMPFTGVNSRAGTEIAALTTMFTERENERIEEARQRKHNAPAPQPGPVPGNHAVKNRPKPQPLEVEEPKSPRADIHLPAPKNKRKHKRRHSVS